MSLSLSEVKHVLGSPFTNAFLAVPFLELFNDAEDLDLTLLTLHLRGVLEGDLAGAADVAYSLSYLMLFDNSAAPDTSAWCKDCRCRHTINARFCKRDVRVLDVDEEHNERLIVNVSWGMGTADWITIDAVHRPELSDGHRSELSGGLDRGAISGRRRRSARRSA